MSLLTKIINWSRVKSPWILHLNTGACNACDIEIVGLGEAVSRYEAPRGEDFHYVRANGTEKPDRVKGRAPTLANIQAVSRMLEDRYLVF